MSVVIPAFNVERYLGRAIRSVLSQSYPRIECIVVDDGSTDGTAEVISTFGKRIRGIRRLNGGVSMARNAGIDAAAGRYIAFLDGDDYWLRNKLELQVDALLRVPELGVISSELEWMRSDTDPECVDPSETILDPSRLELFRGLEYLITNPYLGTSTVVVDTALARAVGGFDTSLIIGEDIDFYFRVCADRPYAILRQKLVRCQFRPGSLSAQRHGYTWNLRVLDRLLSVSPTFAARYGALVQIQREAIYTEWIESLIFHGDGRGAREVLATISADTRIPDYWNLYLKSWFASPIRTARRVRRHVANRTVARTE